jgi:hypothetical protein
MSREQQLCVMNIVQDGVPGSGPANSVELVTESQARNGACPAPYDTVPSLCANVTLRSFYTDRTRTDVYVRINSLTTPLANPVLNSAVSTPGLPSGLGIFSYGNLGLAGSPEAAASRDWVFQTTGASFSFTGSVVTNMAEFANGLDDDCDLRVDEGIANYANGIACVDNTDCTSTLCQGGICAPTTCSNGALDAGETDLDCGGICGASCVGDKICTAGTDCVTGQCVSGLCLGSTGDACIGNLSCVNQVCNPNANLTSEVLTFAPEAVGPNATPITTDNLGAAFDDEAYTGAIPLGFTFNFFGNRYSNIYVSSNGWASFTAPTSSSLLRAAIPATGTPNNLIAMWWADLDPGDSGTVTYETTGSAPNRKFILNFDNVADYAFGGTPSTFQLVLTETTNTVDLHCTDCTNGGSVSRTQGIENATGTVGLATAGVNNAIATKTNTSIRFNTVTLNGFCAAAACTDGVDNGNETGVDCGGTCGSNCADGITCNQGSDCLRGNCTAGICISCFDGIKNQTEGDTDCGGSCALRCGSSQTCNVTGDCISGICDASNICVPTGDPGDACASDNDCDSKVCDAGGPGSQGGYPLNLNGLITAGTPVVDAFGDPLGDDDVSAAIPLGFDFPFYDTTQTQVVISSNGWLTFGATPSAAAPIIPSTSTPNGIVAFFGRDLDASEGGTITYATVGTAPNREFLVNFNNISDYYFSIPDHAPITLQVALQETSGYIDIRCVNCVSGTAEAVVGVESMSGTLGVAAPSKPYFATRNVTNSTIRFQTVTRVVGTCLAPTCFDVTVNQDESGIDCGGAVCAVRCDAGQACVADGDCDSSRCENAVCSTCTDGIKSGTETDVDCGGVCGSTCTDTKICTANSDCASDRCEGGICTSCNDGLKNGSETDIDCGGVCGGTCNFAETCSVNADCYTGNCAAGSCGKGATGANCGGGIDCDSQVCAPSIAKGASDVATTFNLIPTTGFTPVTLSDGDEGNALLQIGFSFPFFTGTFTELSLSSNGFLTFGGAAPTYTYGALLGSSTTPNNFVTFFNRDLEATASTAILSGTVGTAPNRKFVIDIQNLEDYYGSIPDHDPVSLQIQLNETTGYIDLMYISGNSGTTTVRVGAEGPSTGGSTPDFVALTGYNPGSTAFANQAVRLGTFNQYPGLCAAPNCSDATKNQAETDIDCGGQCGAVCTIGKGCSTVGDCDPGAAGVAECLLVGTATICMNCGDGTKNGNEADVDCGGSCATDCVSGQTCGGNGDCDSNLCVGGLCAGCADATQNGSETDVDCGGADCGPCFGGKICAANADCLSGSCVGGFCALGATASSCNQGDQCLNGVCGGGTIPAANGVTVTWNPHSSINDETAGTRASSSIGGTAKLGDGGITPAIPLGFNFRYFDQIYTSAYIDANGYLSFVSPSNAHSPPSVSPSTSSPNAVIAPFWFDADPSAGNVNTDVRYLTTGTAPNRKFIVNWIKIPYWLDSTDKATFQVILYENGGYLDLNCKDCTLTTTSPSRAQIVENADGTQAFSAFSLTSSTSFNIPDQTAKRYFTNATNGASCLAPTCSDGVKNQGETDTDCGGAACGATCAPTKICAADTDCGGLGASCAGGFCRNCADGVLNGLETGLDCGGQCGATCGGGLACNSAADCATGGCTGGLCDLGATGALCTAGAQCADGVCSTPAPVAITTAPDAASLGNITAGTQATSFGSKLGDTGHSDAVTLPFVFNFFGTDYSSVKINGNGWISFDASSTSADSPPTTSPSSFNPNAVIAGYWFDADADISASADIRYTTVGTAPNRKFIVNYVALPWWNSATDTATFQIALNEGTNTVDIFCADCTLLTTSTFSGQRSQFLENGAGTVAISAYSLTRSATFNIPDNTGYRYNTSSVKACQAPTATDGVKNGSETDVDCGGTSGTLCAPTKICIADTDCGGANATCTGGTCRNCSDTVKNGNETDIDCGGICGGNCGFNKICGLGSDCASQNCVSGLCGLSADGFACSANGDCASNYCDGLKGATTATLSLVGALSDGTNGPAGDQVASAAIPLGFKFRYFGAEYASVKLTTNGHISFAANPSPSNYSTQTNSISMWTGDMDAGAGQIKYQTIGTAPFRKFIVNYNSLANYYTGPAVQAQAVLHESLNYVDILCVSCGVETSAPLSHFLAVRGATSADILEVGTLGTSGSTTALPANSGYRFVTDPLPTAGKICAPATCRDAATNGTESAPDCGGSCGADCIKGAVCSSGADCQSGTCTGGFCAGIADAAACTLSGACASGVCTAGACAAPLCNDAVKNGAETDLDCGGATCGATCTAGKLCGGNTDCAANRCEGSLCRTCADGVQSGAETGADCGGPCGATCLAGQACGSNSDCASDTCVGGFCADCFDGVQNGFETGVDCGGACVNKCQLNIACSVGTDCVSGTCTAGVCVKGATGASCSSSNDCSDKVCGGGNPTVSTISYAPYGSISSSAGFTVLSLSGDDATASPAAATPIGFSFNFFGASYTQFGASTNGNLQFGSAATTATAGIPSTSITNRRIAYFQRDLNVTSGAFRFRTVGLAPNRMFVFNADSIPLYGDAVTPGVKAQVKIYEGSNRVEIHCQNCQTGTNGGTYPTAIGIDKGTGATAATGVAALDSLGGAITGKGAGLNYSNSAWAFSDQGLRTCSAPTTTDGVQNGTETAVDCGGTSGKQCGAALACNVGGDCLSGACSGGLCSKSSVGGACSVAADCTSLSCASNLCVAVANGLACTQNSDCITNTCSSNVCQGAALGASCAGNAQCQSNYCSGGVCALQPAGGACLSNADCASNLCEASICRVGSGVACSADNQCSSNFCLSTTGTKVVQLTGATWPGSLGDEPAVDDFLEGTTIGSITDGTQSAATINFPFSPSFFGTDVTRFRACPNGFLSLGTGGTGGLAPSISCNYTASSLNTYLNTAQTNSGTTVVQNGLVVMYAAIYWVKAAGSSWTTKTFGSPGDRKFAVNYNMLHNAGSGGPMKAQVIFYEATAKRNVVDVVCKSCRPYSTRTDIMRQGLESITGSARLGFGTRLAGSSSVSYVDETIRYQTAAATSAVCF